MTTTQVRGEQILDGSIKAQDLDLSGSNLLTTFLNTDYIFTFRGNVNNRPSFITGLNFRSQLGFDNNTILAVANGGTGTTTGCITGSTALTFTAGGTNQNITLTPSGIGYTLLNGNVGIGTTNPGAKLHLSGIPLTSFTDNTNKGIALIEGDGYDNGDIMAIDFKPSIYVKSLARVGARITTNGSFIDFGTSNSYVTGITNTALTINPSGYVGIGITNPNNLLCVGYNIANASPLANIGYNPTSGNVTSTNGYLSLINIVAADPISGISTGAMLGFNSSANNFYGQGIGAARNSKYDIWFQTGATNGGGYRFYTGTNENVTFTNTGSVGIGTTTPYYKGDIAGDLRIQSTNKLWFGGTTAAGTDYFYASVSGTINTGSVFTQKSTLALESAPLGIELTDTNNWTTTTGWTGNYDTGFTHTTGVTTLSRIMTNTIGNLYQISFTVTGRTAGSFTVGLGGEISNKTFSATGTYAPKTLSTNGDLIFTPTTDFDGTISAISVKLITGTYPATYIIQDNSGSNILEVRSSSHLLYNSFIGVEVGRYNTTGYYNTAQGFQSLRSNTTGYCNTAQGVQSLFSNTTGFSNTAQGFYSLFSNTTGYCNTAQGVYSLYYNTTGYQNTANGYASLYYNTIGNYNTANGYASLYSNTIGNYNTANGYASLYSNTTGNYNTANGFNSLYYNTTGYYNTSQGVQSLFSNTTGYGNTAQGYYSLFISGKTVTAGTFIVGVSYTIISVGNTDFTIIGSVNNNVGTIFTATGVGSGTGTAASNSNNNTANGYQAGRYAGSGTVALTAPSNSVFIGNGTRASADGNINENVIGYAAIGNGSNTVTLGNTNITNTYLKGAVSTNSTITGTQLVSTITVGTAPLSVTSTTKVDNLNADLLDGQHGSYYAAATALHNPVTLDTNSGLKLTGQVLAMDIPSSVTGTSTNSVTTNTHTHTVSGLTNSNLAANASISITKLANYNFTIGTTTIALGGGSQTLTGLTSVTSTDFIGDLTGTASVSTKILINDGNNDYNYPLLFSTQVEDVGYNTYHKSDIYYNPVKQTLVSTYFEGRFSGDLTGTADASLQSDKILMANAPSNYEYNLLLTNAITGDYNDVKFANGILTYNPSTGILTASRFAGMSSDSERTDAIYINTGIDQTDSIFYIPFITDFDDYFQLYTTYNIGYNPNSNLLYTNVEGNLTGTASYATNSDKLDNAHLETSITNSDLKIPSSKAILTALNLKANLVSPSFTTPILGNATATSIKLTSGATEGYIWKCTNVDGSGIWSNSTNSQVYKGTVDGDDGKYNGGATALIDGTGTQGWYYRCIDAGTYDYGNPSGNSITLAIGDDLIYNGTIWQRSPGQGYTLQTASSTVLGGVKIGSNVAIDVNGIISVHDPLTIATTYENGLFWEDEETQNLGLNLASTSTNGALSSTDWNIFNNKVSFPGFGTTHSVSAYGDHNHTGIYAPLASPTFTGTVTIPTPFTLGAVSVTTTGTKLNYLSQCGGTTGTTSTNLVFSTSPTLVTPILGVATVTSINKLTITQPATSAVLTISNGKTLTCAKTLTLTGTDSTTMTFPTTNATIARTDAGQTFTGVQIMTSPTFLVSPIAPTQVEGDTSTKLATDEFVSRAINSAIFHSDTKSITITQTTVTGTTYHCLSTDYTVAFIADTEEEPTIYLPTTVGNDGRIICCANISAFYNSAYAVRIVPDDTNTEHLMWSDDNIIRLGSGYECVTLQCHRGQSTGYWVIIGKGF